MECKICKTEHDNILSFIKHVSYKHCLSSKEYYDKYIMTNSKSCDVCGEEAVFYSMIKGYAKTCGKQSCKQLVRKQTNVEKYGFDSPLKNENVMRKMKDTNLKKYGFENVHCNEDIKQKAIDTCLRNFGCEYSQSSPIVRLKSLATIRQKYNADHIFQNEEMQQKRKETFIKKFNSDSYIGSNEFKKMCVEKYGFENPSCNDNVKLKKQLTSVKHYGVKHPSQSYMVYENQNGFHWKDYCLPSGKIIKIQGYENKALDELLQNYSESDIVTQRCLIPEIWYYTEDGRKHRYFPDIFIPKENLIIEVKSKWTYEKEFAKNLLKQTACIQAGYNFKFMIMV